MSIFGMRLLGGEVTAKKFAKFNAMRKLIMFENPQYEQYLGKKGWAVRTFVDVIITFPHDFMELVEKTEADHGTGRS